MKWLNNKTFCFIVPKSNGTIEKICKNNYNSLYYMILMKS